MSTVHFSKSVEGLKRATEKYSASLLGFDAEDWLSKPNNILVCKDDDYAMLDKNSDGIYTGHYFFSSKGVKALRVGKEMLSFIFDNTDIQVIRGLTPLTKVAARWFSRQVGFTSHGVVQTTDIPCELFILTRKDFKEL